MKNPFKKSKKAEVEEVVVEDIKEEEAPEEVEENTAPVQPEGEGNCDNCKGSGLVGAVTDARSVVCDVCKGTGNK